MSAESRGPAGGRWIGAGIVVALAAGAFLWLRSGTTAPPAPAPEAQTPAPEAPVADHHLHIRSAAGAELLARVNALDAPAGEEAPRESALGADDVIEALDSAGIRKGLVLSIAYMYGMPELGLADPAADVRAENEWVASEVQRYPDRLFGACSVSPLADFALDEVAACAENPYLHALKLHMTNSDVDLRDSDHLEALAAVFRAAGERSLPVIIHLRTRNEAYGAEDARLFINGVLSQAPELPVQIAHMGGWGGYDDATDAAMGAFIDAFEAGRLAREPYTFGIGAVVFDADVAPDTALANAVRRNNERVAERIRQVGTDRVVYATDWPSWPPVRDVSLRIRASVQLQRKALPLDPAELAAVFRATNAWMEGSPREAGRNPG
jgi:predicted TIM-barrel fold metal-dependent hydrolase